MEENINGKSYDTETAECLYEWSYDCSYGDFNSCEEALYKTKNEEYFLAGSGGAMSKFSEINGNTISGGYGIQLIDEAEAIEWLKQHDGVEAIEQYFPSHIIEG